MVPPPPTPDSSDRWQRSAPRERCMELPGQSLQIVMPFWIIEFKFSSLTLMHPFAIFAWSTSTLTSLSNDRLLRDWTCHHSEEVSEKNRRKKLICWLVCSTALRPLSRIIPDWCSLKALLSGEGFFRGHPGKGHHRRDLASGRADDEASSLSITCCSVVRARVQWLR